MTRKLADVRIAFDLVVKDTAANNPKGVTTYVEIGATLVNYGFQRVQGSLYVCDNEDMANLMDAMDALTKLSWFPASVRDIRAFRIEQWSDFTPRLTHPPKAPLPSRERGGRSAERGLVAV